MIWDRIISEYGRVVFDIPETGMRRKRREIFVIFFTIEKKKEKEKEGTICKRKTYFFDEEMKNGEGKGEKYLEKEKYILYGGEGKGGKYLEKGNIFFANEKKNGGG